MFSQASMHCGSRPVAEWLDNNVRQGYGVKVGGAAVWLVFFELPLFKLPLSLRYVRSFDIDKTR